MDKVSIFRRYKRVQTPLLFKGVSGISLLTLAIAGTILPLLGVNFTDSLQWISVAVGAIVGAILAVRN